jgi:hypothetical protein
MRVRAKSYPKVWIGNLIPSPQSGAPAAARSSVAGLRGAGGAAMSQQKALRQGLPLGSQEVTRLDELRGMRSGRSTCARLLHEPPKETGLMLGLLRQPGGFEGLLGIERPRGLHHFHADYTVRARSVCRSQSSGRVGRPALARHRSPIAALAADVRDSDMFAPPRERSRDEHRSRHCPNRCWSVDPDRSVSCREETTGAAP